MHHGNLHIQMMSKKIISKGTLDDKDINFRCGWDIII